MPVELLWMKKVAQDYLTNSFVTMTAVLSKVFMAKVGQ